MRVKSIAVFLIVVVLMTLLSLWQVDSAFFNEQTSQGEGAARAQLASIVPGLQAEYRSLGSHVKLLASQTVDRGVTDFNDAVSIRVEMIARLRPTETGEFFFESKAFHDKTKVRNWAENYTTIALKALKPKDVPTDGASVVALLDPQRKSFFLWIFRDAQERWAAVITKPTILQNLMDRQKGLFGSVIVVNQQGQVLGHTTSEYVGTSLADDPLVNNLMKSGRRTHSGYYKENNGQTSLGYFEIVPATNTYVALSRPMVPLQKSRNAIRWQLLFLGGGFLFVGLAAFVYVQRSETAGGSSLLPTAKANPKPTPGLSPTPAPAAGGAVTKPPDPKGSEGDLLKERMKAYTTSASALARELHGPIARILGLTKILTGRDLPGDSKSEVGEIEELARDSRAILRKLLSFAGEEEYQMEPTGVNESITRALSNLETKMNAKGIKVEKHLKRVSLVKGHSVGLAKCFEAMLMNSIEAMERMPSKRITLDLEGDSQWVTLKIRDTGEGIPAESVEKVFDPFFSLKNRSIHSGLGLSMSLGVIHEFGGDIEVTSEPGKGTLLVVRLPVHPDAKLEEVAVAPAPAPAAVAVVAEKPAPASDLKPAVAAVAAAPKPAAASAPAKIPAADLSEKTGKTQVPVDVPKAPASSNPLSTLMKKVTAPIAAAAPIQMRQAAPPPLPPKAATAPPTKPPPSVAKPSLLHERAIQETMDAIDNVDEPAKKKSMPPPPPAPGQRPAPVVEGDEPEAFIEKKLTEKASPPPVSGTESVNTKINRPQMGMPPPKPKLVVVEAGVRKPGEKPVVGRGGQR